MRDQDIEYEERGIYLVIAAASVPIVIGTLFAHEVFDAGATICLGLVMLAVFGLLGVKLQRRPGLPIARTAGAHARCSR